MRRRWSEPVVVVPEHLAVLGDQDFGEWRAARRTWAATHGWPTDPLVMLRDERDQRRVRAGLEPLPPLPPVPPWYELGWRAPEEVDE